MSGSNSKLYEFGVFRLDPAERVVWRGQELLVLPPKVYETLWMLVQTEGRVVSKSELMEAIWADAFVEESNLSQNIYTLRRTLGVDEQGRQFIETVPRRGYRFAIPVRLSDIPNGNPKLSVEVPQTRSSNSNEVSALELVESSFVAASSLQRSSDDHGAPATPGIPAASPSASEVRSSAHLPYAAIAGLALLVLSTFGLY